MLPGIERAKKLLSNFSDFLFEYDSKLYQNRHIFFQVMYSSLRKNHYLPSEVGTLDLVLIFIPNYFRTSEQVF